MQKSLQKRLESGVREVRQAAIDELVELSTEEPISTLKQVIEGKRRSLFTKYDFNDQAYAMKALLKLGSKEANDFLTNILHEHIYFRRSEGMPADPYYGVPGWEGVQHSFPNAKGELQKRLTYFQWANCDELISAETSCAALDYELFEKYIRFKGYDKEAHIIRKTILDELQSKAAL